jgi:hypothetical protein
MRVSYFPNQCAQNSVPVVQAMLDSLRYAGHIVTQDSMDADAAIIWSVLWAGRMAPNKQVYEHYRTQGKPVIIVDVGALYRGNTWKISVNNITADGYYGHRENLDPGRPRKLGISLATQFQHNPYILIAAQHNQSLQLAEVDIEAWISQQIEKIRLVTDMPIHIRPHPRCRLKLNQLPQDVEYETPQKIKNTYDNFDMHFDCHAVVNYNSGPGIQAAISGTRPVVDLTSLAHPVSVSVQDINKPYNVDREQWLIEICHTEYTLNELQKGTWIKRLAPAL